VSRFRVILPGRWRCVSCGECYALAYTPGVLVKEPLGLPGPCKCGGQIVAADDRAHDTCMQIRENARAHAEWVGAALKDDP
jgi:hypothetical protein